MNIEFGHGKPAFLIAELSNNHNGDLATAIQLIDAAKDAGASAVKLQAYTPDELIQLRGDGRPPAPWEHMTMRELYLMAMTPADWFPALFAHAEFIDIPIFSSVFGMQSLQLLEDMDCPMYKIASLDRHAASLRDAVKATGKPWIISRPDYAESDAPTLYCPPGYPQSDIDLSVIRTGRFAGFSYHGTDWTVPAASVKHGAQIVEVHFQLDDEPSKLEAGVSLTASAFAAMVDEVRAFESVAVRA